MWADLMKRIPRRTLTMCGKLSQFWQETTGLVSRSILGIKTRGNHGPETGKSTPKHQSIIPNSNKSSKHNSGRVLETTFELQGHKSLVYQGDEQIGLDIIQSTAINVVDIKLSRNY